VVCLTDRVPWFVLDRYSVGGLGRGDSSSRLFEFLARLGCARLSSVCTMVLRSTLPHYLRLALYRRRPRHVSAIYGPSDSYTFILGSARAPFPPPSQRLWLLTRELPEIPGSIN